VATATMHERPGIGTRRAALLQGSTLPRVSAAGPVDSLASGLRPESIYRVIL